MKITVNQLRRIIREEVQNLTNEVILENSEHLDDKLKKVFLDSIDPSRLLLRKNAKEKTAIRNLESEYAEYLQDMYGDDGFQWTEHLKDLLGNNESVEDYADYMVNNYLSDF